ncbi:MAG TPA: hypothetical protein VNJ07_04775 [Chitinophagales bacterium]|nr:hypothetical protein [Chitinophagales bacterium]
MKPIAFSSTFPRAKKGDSPNETDGSVLGGSLLASRKGVVREDWSEGSGTAKSGTDEQERHTEAVREG